MAGRTSDERGTPAYIIEAARKVMGSIDLDPASCAEANEVVRAGRYYDKNDDGLAQPWYGNVWLNPPFSQPLCAQFVEKLIHEWSARDVRQAIVLVNVSTGRWYHRLLGTFPVAFPRHHDLHPNARIEFYPLPGNDRGTDNNSRGQAVFYLDPGGQAERFYQVFGEFCTIPGRLCP
jgi:ParB family transcriptional regulator, chromosome partitioning protein